MKALLPLLFLTTALFAADQPQWGQAWTRNLVSAEKNLPESWNLETGENVKWIAPLGTHSYATPIVAGGRVFIGTNNEVPRDPAHLGDRGAYYCLDEKDGHLLWQLLVPKRDEDQYYDWPKTGMSSAITVEGDRGYLVDNRGEVLCLNLRGLAEGNEGPYRDESAHLTSLPPPLRVHRRRHLPRAARHPAARRAPHRHRCRYRLALRSPLRRRHLAARWRPLLHPHRWRLPLPQHRHRRG